MMKSTTLILIFAVLALLPSTGCSQIGIPTNIADDPALQKVKASNPLPFKVGVAPIEIKFTAANLNKPESGRWAHEPDKARMRESMVTAIHKYNVFKDVESLDIPATEEGKKDLLSVAWDKGFDLVLELAVTKYETFWDGFNGNYPWNVINYLTVGFTAWWVADEDYGADIEVVATLRSVHSRRVVHRETYRVQKSYELDDTDRGTHFMSIFRVPGSLDEGNWENIKNAIMPHGIEELKRVMIMDLGKDLPVEVKKPKHKERTAKTMALVVGLSRYEDYHIPQPLGYCDNDANAVTEFLKESSGLADHQVATLIDNNATRANIQKALDHLKTKIRSNDQVMIYYSGYIAKPAENRAFLIPYDAKMSNLEATAFSFEAFGKELKKLGAKTTWLVFDSSISEEKNTRSLIVSTNGSDGGGEEENSGENGGGAEAAPNLSGIWEREDGSRFELTDQLTAVTGKWLDSRAFATYDISLNWEDASKLSGTADWAIRHKCGLKAQTKWVLTVDGPNEMTGELELVDVNLKKCKETGRRNKSYKFKRVGTPPGGEGGDEGHLSIAAGNKDPLLHLAGDGRVLIMAARPGQGARTMEASGKGKGKEGKGLFTHYILEGARGEGPGAKVRKPTLTGAFEHASKMVPLRLGLDGGEQEPIMMGLPKAEFPIKPIGDKEASTVRVRPKSPTG